MNKKIKVIELLNKIANGEEIPKEIKFKNKIYKYYKEQQDYIVYTDEDEFCGETLLFNVMRSHFMPELLEKEVEILEGNTEEIEEYKGESFEQLGYEVGKLSIAIAKGFEKAIKELGKEKSNE